MCMYVHLRVPGNPSRLYVVEDKLTNGTSRLSHQSDSKNMFGLSHIILERSQFTHSKKTKQKTNLFPQSWADCSGSHLVLNLIAKQRRSQKSFRTAGVEMLVGVSSPELEAPLKCQLSVWKRDKLSDQSGISSFIIHSEPIQSLGAQGHRALSSMPPLIIRPHQRLFGLSNQCLFNGMPSPQETTNEYFISPLIQS